MADQSLVFSILMPTYNDEEYILQAIQSVVAQDDNNWELIIVNDGSTDGTERLVKSIKDTRIRYLYQENSDQLNALVRGSEVISGDIVVLLHSDDMLNGVHTLSRLRREFETDSSVVGLFADYIKINEKGDSIGTLRTRLACASTLLATIFLSRGSNVIGDHFIIRKEYFLKYIIPDYLKDNTIYYLGYDKPMLHGLKKVSSWYRYRVYEDNYLNTDIGKYVALSGQFRTLFKLFKAGYSIKPFLPKNHLLFKFTRRYFSILFRGLKGKEFNQQQVVSYYSLWKRELELMNYPPLLIRQIDKIIRSAKTSVRHRHKPLCISYAGEKMYFGKDARCFFRDMSSGSINSLYLKLLNEDYDHVIVSDERSLVAVQEALKYFSFFYPVEIIGAAGNDNLRN